MYLINKRRFELNTANIIKIATLVLLIAAIAALICGALALSRDYQDSWVLEGLEIPFFFFVAIYASAFFFEKRIASLVVLASVGRIVFLLIPNLKYVWFQGRSIDQFVQYGLANQVCNTGHIATQGHVGISIYGSTPLLHLALAMFSSVLSVPVVDAVKFLPIFLSPIYPLLTYVVVKNLKFLKGSSVLKYCLFVSSVPLSSDSYVITGSLFGVLLAFLALTTLVILLQRSERKGWFVFVFFILALAMAHSVSSLLLAIFFVAVFLIQRISHFRLGSYFKLAALFAVVSITLAWQAFPANYTFESILRGVFSGPMGGAPTSEAIPGRFFELASVNILETLRAALVYYGATLFLLLLMIASLAILLKAWKQIDNSLKFIVLIAVVMVSFIPLGALLKVGMFRVVNLGIPLFPIFAGIFIGRAGKRRPWLRALIFSSIMILATVQLYGCQPLLPSANILSSNLPADQPISYLGNTNSVYQRQLAAFATSYVVGTIACDRVTENQITGLSELNFSNHLAYYYPLDKSQPEKEYDYFFIHLPGISGAFEEKAELRTKDLILETIYNSSIIYTNGESYALLH
jgi:hypothetical protein